MVCATEVRHHDDYIIELRILKNEEAQTTAYMQETGNNDLYDGKK